LAWSFSDQEIDEVILGNATGEPLGSGTLLAGADDIIALGRDYLMSITQTEAERIAIALEKGDMTMDGVTSEFKRQASTAFPQFAESLDSGFTVREATTSMRTKLGNTLGIAPELIDFNDDRWADVIDHVDSSGNRRMMTSAEAGRWARTQPEFATSDGSKSIAANVVHQISGIMGARA